MTPTVCPYCHAPLATTELERVLIAGQFGLLCPECSGLVFLQPRTRDHSLSLEVHRTEAVHA